MIAASFQCLFIYCFYLHRKFVNKRDEDDAQALHYAVESRCTDTVHLLLRNGAKFNSKCRLKTTGIFVLYIA